MVAPAGCILHATSCTGTCGRATSAQAQALCRDAPPKLWIVARAHAVLHCSTLLVAHIKSEFAKCTFAEVSQTRPLQAPAASAVAPTDGRAHRLPLRVCGRCIGSFSIHAYARAALLPPYHAWLNGAHAKRSLPCTGVPYAAWRKAERHPLLASPLTPPPAPQMTWCTILRLLANAQDAQATSEIRKWTFAEVSFFRGAQL